MDLSIVFLTGYGGGFLRSLVVIVKVSSRKKKSSFVVAELLVKPHRKSLVYAELQGIIKSK